MKKAISSSRFLLLLMCIFFTATALQAQKEKDSTLKKVESHVARQELKASAVLRSRCHGINKLAGEWELVKDWTYFPDENNLSARRRYNINIDSSGSVAPHNEYINGGWIKRKDSLHLTFKWNKDVYQYKIDSFSCDYVRMHRFEVFENQTEYDAPYPRDNTGDIHFTETFTFKRSKEKEKD